MHTFGKTDRDNNCDWYFHHNGGFAGDIIIVRRDWDGKSLEARTTSEVVLREVVKYADGLQCPDPLFNMGDAEAQLKVPMKILASFVADRYVIRGLEYWLESLSDEEALRMLNWFKDEIRNGSDEI